MLALDPKVLLLDEPTSYLDEATADILFQVLAAQAEHTGLTVAAYRARPAPAHALGLAFGGRGAGPGRVRRFPRSLLTTIPTLH